MSETIASLRDDNLAKRWIIFINERFPLLEHLVGLFFLTLGNSIIASAITKSHFSLEIFVISFTICFLFFFRLRCFDEIKDYEIDLRINPTRPLVRGVLTRKQVKIMFVLVTLIELSLAFKIGINAFYVHAIAVGYSYLMYKEFFLSDYICPHLTTYAISHTFVSVLVVYSVFTQITNIPITQYGVELVIFGLASWAIFNLFEFARKTYALEEERTNVPTYSTTFGITGATLLSLSQVAAAVSIVYYIYMTQQVINLWDLYVHLAAAAVPTLAGIFFIVRKTALSVKIFRKTCSTYLVIYFALLAFQGFSSNLYF